MATILGIQIGSKFPSTEKYENQQLQLISDNKRYNEYSESPSYKRLTELDEIVHTGEFEKRVDKLKNEQFKGTDAYHKYKSYLELKNSKDIKGFMKFINSGKEKKLNEYLISPNYIEYLELEEITTAGEFKKIRAQKGFKKTDEYKQLKRFNKLRRSTEVKFVLKTLRTSLYQTYNTIKESSVLEKYISLDAYVNTDEFKELKVFLEDKKRFYKSEEYKLLHEYESIKKTEDYKWFEKTKDANPFEELDKWEKTFSDDFDGTSLDSSKWMTGYYWGKALMNDNYVLSHEKQFFTDNNIETRDSHLKINTRKEHCTGKSWNPEHGFAKAEFEYTSGLVNTGHSFRQKYGKFEVKAKLKTSKLVNHAFWMLGEKMTPQLTVFKTGTNSAKKFEAGSIISNNGQIEDLTNTISGASFTNDYHIFTLEWSAKKITWKINGLQVHEQTSGIPQQPMYLLFSTHLNHDVNGQSMPSFMEIDWVRCYQTKA